MLDNTYKRYMPPPPPKNYWIGFIHALVWCLLGAAFVGVITMLVYGLA